MVSSSSTVDFVGLELTSASKLDLQFVSFANFLLFNKVLFLVRPVLSLTLKCVTDCKWFSEPSLFLSFCLARVSLSFVSADPFFRHAFREIPIWFLATFLIGTPSFPGISV
jgi:hypothetical protein